MKLLTIAELAEYIKKPVSWLYRNQHKLGIPHILIGQQYRYDIDDIDLWVESLKPQRRITMSIYSEMSKEWEEYEFRRFKCTGKNCGFATEGLSTLAIFCNTPGCKGEVTARKKVPNKTYIKQSIKQIQDHRGGFNSALNARFCTISPTLRREIEGLE